MSSIVLENKVSNIAEYRFRTVKQHSEKRYTLSTGQRIQLMLLIKTYSFMGLIYKGDNPQNIQAI